MSCLHVHDDGAYVLGALSPTERLAFEKHLADCQECTRAVRELAGLPGLLGRVDLSVVEHPLVAVPLPETLLPALSREVRRTRRRRGQVTAALTAAAVVLAVSASVAVSRLTDDQGPQAATRSTTSPSASAPIVMSPVGDVPLRASVSLDSVTWGTRLGLICTYDSGWVDQPLPEAPAYVLFVRTRDGRSEQVGTWLSSDGKTMRLSAATAASRADIAAVEVRTTSGRVLLKLTA